MVKMIIIRIISADYLLLYIVNNKLHLAYYPYTILEDSDPTYYVINYDVIHQKIQIVVLFDFFQVG